MFALSVLFSPTAESTNVFGDIFDPLWTFGTEDAITPRNIEKVHMVMHYLKKCFPDGIEGQQLNCFILMDDCGPLQVMNSPVMNKLASNCRNDNITLFIAVQNFHQIKPTVRENCDFFLANITPKRGVRKLMYDDLWNDIGPYSTFLPIYLQATSDRGGFVWTNFPAESVTQKYFTYQPAHTVADFKLRSPLQEFLVDLMQKTKEQRDVEEQTALDNLLNDSDAEVAPEEEKKEKPKKRKRKDDEEEDLGLEPVSDVDIQPGDDGGNDDLNGQKKARKPRAKKDATSRKAPAAKKPKVHCIKSKAGAVLFTKAEAVDEDID
jgi:hypothetical protein